MRTHLYICSLPLVSILFIVGCGGGSDSENTQTLPDPVVTLPAINPPQVKLAPLKPATEASLQQHLNNALYFTFNSDSTQQSSPVVSPSLDAANTEQSTGRFSQTVTQEQGVDESDMFKYNGEQLFIAVQTEQYNYFPMDATLASNPANEAPMVRILAKQADASLNALPPVLLTPSADGGAVHIEGIFATSTHLYTLTTEWAQEEGVVTPAMMSSSSLWYGPGATSSSMQVKAFQLDDQGASMQQTIQLDGRLVDARRVGDKLVLLSSFEPLNVPLSWASTDAQRQANLQALEELPTQSLLPTYTHAGGTAPLVTPEQCYIPEDTDALDGFAGIVALSIVDLTDFSQVQSICVNAWVDGLYANHTDVVLYAQQPNGTESHTVLHHFSLANSPRYNASVVVEGELGWALPQLRLSIHNDILRVVTSQWQNDENDRWDHTLSTFSLETDSNVLPRLAQLPNTSRPDEIGKPNENITAVRFFGDTAYVVTFEQIDPLYAINLTEPSQPYIQGALDIPGFSSYLQPLPNQFLLGIGQNVDPNRFMDVPLNSTAAPVVEGAKVALFDVSGSAPRLVDEIVFANAATPAEFDYKAMTYLPRSDDDIRIGLPMQAWQHIGEHWQAQMALSLLSIATTNGGQMLEHGTVPVTDAGGWGVWQDRAVFDGDDIYYIHAQQVIHSKWTAPEVVLGRY